MKTGKVKIWQHDRGYGYITPDDGSDDVFVHFNGIAGEGFRQLTPGETVQYVLVAGYQSVQAAQVAPYQAEQTDV